MPASRGRFQRKGRILYVTRDEELLRKQLGGEDPDARRRRASRRQHLDRRAHARVGLLLLRRDARSLLPRRPARRRAIEKDAIKSGGFGVIVSGVSKGCGSSRETAPYSELASGHPASSSRKSIEKIYAAERAEHRPAHVDRLRRSSSASSAARRSRSSEFTRGPRPDQRRRSSSTAVSSRTTTRASRAR